MGIAFSQFQMVWSLHWQLKSPMESGTPALYPWNLCLSHVLTRVSGCPVPILQDRGAQQLTPIYFLARSYSIAMLTVSPISPRITISRLASLTSSSTIIPYLRFYSYSWKPEENTQDLVAQPQNDELLVHCDSSSKIIQMPEINLSFGT